MKRGESKKREREREKRISRNLYTKEKQEKKRRWNKHIEQALGSGLPSVPLTSKMRTLVETATLTGSVFFPIEIIQSETMSRIDFHMAHPQNLLVNLHSLCDDMLDMNRFPKSRTSSFAPTENRSLSLH